MKMLTWHSLISEIFIPADSVQSYISRLSGSKESLVRLDQYSSKSSRIIPGLMNSKLSVSMRNVEFLNWRQLTTKSQLNVIAEHVIKSMLHED